MSGRNVIIVKHKEVRSILISGLICLLAYSRSEQIEYVAEYVRINELSFKEYKYNEHIRVFTTAPLVQMEEPTWVNTKHPWLSGFKASCLSMY